jgi:hypothetical protein
MFMYGTSGRLAEVDTEEVALPERIKIKYEDSIVGKELWNYGKAIVIEHTTSNGDVLVVKAGRPKELDRSEAAMMHFAATHGVLAPRVRACYDIVTKRTIARAIVSERVPGLGLDEVWKELSSAQQSSIKDQLRIQIGRMRECTQDYIGRPGHEAGRNIYSTEVTRHFGPFHDEEAFNRWCMTRLPRGRYTHWKWGRVLERRLRKTPSKFVLTHCDLRPQNIIVQDGRITGIVDWEHGCFLPDYVEYAYAMAIAPRLPDWWKLVLEEVLVPCPREMVKFTELIEEKIWRSYTP